MKHLYCKGQHNRCRPKWNILLLYIVLTNPLLIVDYSPNPVDNRDWATEWLHDIGNGANPLTYKYLWSIGRDSNTRLYSFADCCIGPLCHRCIILGPAWGNRTPIHSLEDCCPIRWTNARYNLVGPVRVELTTNGLWVRCSNQHELKARYSWCDWPESNRHALQRQILSLLCIPISPQSQCSFIIYAILKNVNIYFGTPGRSRTDIGQLSVAHGI